MQDSMSCHGYWEEDPKIRIDGQVFRLKNMERTGEDRPIQDMLTGQNEFSNKFTGLLEKALFPERTTMDATGLLLPLRVLVASRRTLLEFMRKEHASLLMGSPTWKFDMGSPDMYPVVAQYELGIPKRDAVLATEKDMTAILSGIANRNDGGPVQVDKDGNILLGYWETIGRILKDLTGLGHEVRLGRGDTKDPVYCRLKEVFDGIGISKGART